ncbi:MAG: hypothetical protein RLZZ618_1686 [Pseudomonadota bacterium]|jgi:hypothetical protein
MNSQKRVMLLIDADNVSADVIDQAVDKVRADHGAIHVRRAYCTPESALANLRLFKAHSIRPIVNLSTGKNSTDISLAVDAIDLAISERPDVAVIVSSDSDFAPLVIRLREKGCRVEGIGQLGKTGEDSKGVYDAFVDIEHRKSRPAAEAPARKRAPARSRGRAAEQESAPAPMPVRAALPVAQAPAEAKAPARRQRGGRAAEAAPAAPTVAPTAASASAPAATPASRRSAARGQSQAPVQAPAPAPRPVMPDDLRRILAVLPELARGARMELGVAAERLRSEELLGANAPATKLFRKYPDWFALSPERQPNKVEYRGLPRE